MDVDTLLADREAQYGSFSNLAEISQSLKTVITTSHGWLKLTDDQREALDLIAMKIARILNGNPNLIDNWDDVSGYAQLISRRLRLSLREDLEESVSPGAGPQCRPAATGSPANTSP